MKKLMATVGVLALLAGTTMAQDRVERSDAAEGRKFEKRAVHSERLMNDIPDLTDDQKAQIRSIKEESRKKMEPQRAEMTTIRSKIAELKKAENPNQQEINKLIDRSSLVKAEMEKSRAASELKVRSILTPEQRKVMDAKMKERKDVREKHHMERKQMQEAK